MAEDIIKGVIGVIVMFVMLSALINVLHDISGDQKRTEIQKIESQKNQEIQQITEQKNTFEEEAKFYKQKYEELINTSITKQDVTEIQKDLQILQIQLQGVQNGTEVINNNINNFYDIKNTYFNLVISIVINFVFVIFIIFDWTFMSFSITKAVMKKLESLLEKMKEGIKKIFKRGE